MHTPMHCILFLKTIDRPVRVHCEPYNPATGTALAMGRPRCMTEQGKEAVATNEGLEHAPTLLASNRLAARVYFGGLRQD